MSTLKWGALALMLLGCSGTSDSATDSGKDTESDTDTDTDSDADSDTDTDADSDTDTDSDTDADADSDTDTDADTDTGTGACDPTGTPVDWYCQSDLCNYCTSDCPTRDEVVASLDMCDPYGSTTVYACCTLDSCAEPTLGSFDRITCPQGYGAAYYWFDPSTGALAAYAWSTDYNDWCDGQSFGEMFGPDLTDCQ